MKILEIEDTTTCHICGKQHLKKVVVLQDDNLNILKAGTSCAAKLMRKNETFIKNAAINAQNELDELKKQNESILETVQVFKDANERLSQVKSEAHKIRISQWCNSLKLIPVEAVKHMEALAA